jgi:hypothetical protein
MLAITSGKRATIASPLVAPMKPIVIHAERRFIRAFGSAACYVREKIFPSLTRIVLAKILEMITITCS